VTPRATLIQRLRDMADEVSRSDRHVLLEAADALDVPTRAALPEGYPALVKNQEYCSKGPDCGWCESHDMWSGESPDGECSWSRRKEADAIAVAWAHFDGRDWMDT
jgi:hypothetical protein